MAGSPLYHSLPHADSIRLFELDSASSQDDPLVGKLVVVRRSQCPRYRALSYMWGPLDPTTNQNLLVNGQVLPLRLNLSLSLRAYRKHLETKKIKQNLPLWIDLICIQQDNLVEKNHQVQQMGAIYKQAYSVLIWLGQNTRHGVIDCFHGTPNAHIALTSEKPQNLPELRLLYRRLLNVHWTRTWIIQELCLAQKVAIFTENNVFASTVMRQIQTERSWIDEANGEGWRPSSNHPNPYAKAVELIERFTRIWSVRDSRMDTRWKPLSLFSTVLMLGRDSECFHHRDKVFAFLEMSSTNASMTVDYERDETLIFWDIVKSATLQDLSFYEIDCLREILQISWSRLLESTKPKLTQGPSFQRMLLPCYLDCGILTTKVSRSRPLIRNCRKKVAKFNCWFQADSTLDEIMLQLEVKHIGHHEYEITDLKVCPREDDIILYGNLVEGRMTMQVLDEPSRWETAAVSAELFMTLGVISCFNRPDFDVEVQAAFPTVTKTKDRYFRRRRATKRYGASLA